MTDFSKGLKREYDFTPSQSALIKDFEEWWNSPNMIYTISGAAGTGKTFVLDYLIKNVIKARTVVTAPTHKATRVAERATGIGGMTLHSLHGLRPNLNLDDFNIDNVRFDTMGAPKIRNYNCIIIDECSQINNSLQTLNEQRARQFGTKIVYVGDPYQLPPVKENLSATFRHKRVFNLTDIVRQEKGNPLLELLAIAREDVKNNTSKTLRYLKDNPHNILEDGTGYAVLLDNDFRKSIVTMFASQDFSQNIDYVRYTAYTNNDILSWNNYIRSMILQDENILSIHDLYMSYKNIVDEFLAPVITNSEDYVVIGGITERISDFGFKEYLLTVRGVNSGQVGNIAIVDHTSDGFTNFYDELNRLHRTALYAPPSVRSHRWKEYFTFKDNHLVMVNFPLMNKDKVPRAWVSKDIDYGYGVTVHKMQGSTIDNIFVNLRDIYYFTNKQGGLVARTLIDPKFVSTRNRLIYTALSRARNKAIILL